MSHGVSMMKFDSSDILEQVRVNNCFADVSAVTANVWHSLPPPWAAKDITTLCGC
jgi:hypothetical protein